MAKDKKENNADKKEKKVTLGTEKVEAETKNEKVGKKVCNCKTEPVQLYNKMVGYDWNGYGYNN